MNWLSQLFTTFGKVFQWWVVVAPWEQGVRIRGGKSRIRLLPGVHFRIPFWDRVYVQAIRRRVAVETGHYLMSRDHKTFSYSLKVEFSITDIEQLYQSVTNPEVLISQRATAAMVAWAIERDAVEISPKALSEHATAQLASVVNWGLTAPEVEVCAFALLRTYRFITTDYRHGARLYDLDEVSGVR